MVVALIAFTARLAAAEPNADEVLDDDAVTGAAEAASFDPGWSDAGAAEEREAVRHDRAPRIGRVDLTITWRRTVRVADMRGTQVDPSGAHLDGPQWNGIASALDPVTTARGVMWVLLTWSR